MIDRLELARSYIQELLEQRSDIVAAWVGGSVARGEDTESSDVDLGLMVSDASGSDMSRTGTDVWRAGVYIEGSMVAQKDYADLEAVLNDPVKATHMNDARILYDPSGFLAKMQGAVRQAFMQPQWLAKRITVELEGARANCVALADAVAAGDPSLVCSSLPIFAMLCIAVPLMRAGVTPSSSRGILQLSAVAPEIAARIFELEGSSDMSADRVLALVPLVREAQGFASPAWGQLPTYFANKAAWLAGHGWHREAVHDAFLNIFVAASGARAHDDPAVRAAGANLAQRWLQSVGMGTAEALAAKVPLAHRLLAYVEALAGAPV